MNIEYPVYFLSSCQISAYILHQLPYDELLPIPDQQESQAVWAELVINLMNIDDVIQQYIVTYELTLMEGVPTMPFDMNITRYSSSVCLFGTFH